MSVNPKFAKCEPWCLQTCPLCGQQMIVIINGVVFVQDKGYACPDRGYSFCNCRNIFFTDWSNIDQSEYFTEEYSTDHKARYCHDQQMQDLFKEYIELIEKESNGGKKLLDIGSVTNYLLREAELRGYKTTGLDIVEHKNFGHTQIIGDFDEIEVLEKFDVIFCNHFLEHIRYPLKAMKKCYDMLNVGGLIFVSMPDPFMIDWNNPAVWGNFILRQHYILWDMDSFCEEMEKIGFKTILKKRNYDIRRLRDYHLLFKK